MIRHLYNNLKWAYQRVRFGYDDTMMWGLEDYFNRALPAIEKFCFDNLKDKESMRLNPQRKEVFSKTISLIEDYKSMSFRDYYKYPNQTSKLWSYIGKNIRYFWD
jgi:hypothetical protein